MTFEGIIICATDIRKELDKNRQNSKDIYKSRGQATYTFETGRVRQERHASILQNHTAGTREDELVTMAVSRGFQLIVLVR